MFGIFWGEGGGEDYPRIFDSFYYSCFYTEGSCTELIWSYSPVSCTFGTWLREYSFPTSSSPSPNPPPSPLFHSSRSICWNELYWIRTTTAFILGSLVSEWTPPFPNEWILAALPEHSRKMHVGWSIETVDEDLIIEI